MLDVTALTKTYGRKTVVDHLTFRVLPGTILGLVGPNGAGKTTTIACIAGLLGPTSGRIEWNGRPLNQEAGIVGLMPESPEVYPLLTVWEHLEFVARLFRLRAGWRDAAEALLSTWDLRPYRDVLGANLSKGLRQRVGLAAMALRQARLLLVDEPMIGLDPRGQREVREMLLRLRGDGAAVVLSSHQLALIEQVADDMIILANGRIVAHDTVAGLQAEGVRAGHASLEDLFMQLTESPPT